MSVLAFRTTHTKKKKKIFFFCQANSKAPKVEQVFPYANCNNHSVVVLFEADVTVWKSSIVRVDA